MREFHGCRSYQGFCRLEWSFCFQVEGTKGQSGLCLREAEDFLTEPVHTMTKATFRKPCLIWGSQFQRIRVYDYHGREQGSSRQLGDGTRVEETLGMVLVF